MKHRHTLATMDIGSFVNRLSGKLQKAYVSFMMAVGPLGCDGNSWLLFETA